MKNLHVVLFVSALLPTYGCSTLGKSAGAGASVGAGVGLIADPGPNGSKRIRNVLIGSAVGGVLGAGVGHILGKNAENDRTAARNQGKNEAALEMQSRLSAESNETQPRLIPPKTEARWVPDLARGSTFIPGHFEYVIIEPARWEMGR